MKNSYWVGINNSNKTKIIGIVLAVAAIGEYRHRDHQKTINVRLFGGFSCTFPYVPVLSLTVFAKYLPKSRKSVIKSSDTLYSPPKDLRVL